jgi:hypothetical protein
MLACRSFSAGMLPARIPDHRRIWLAPPRINPLRFLIAGIAISIFAWLTISFLSFRSATTNPTKALRTE